MSDDGADVGVGAERALKTVLGGEGQPTDEERQSVEEMRASILAAPIGGEFDYDDCAKACARIILEAFGEYPSLKELPTETPMLYKANGEVAFCSEGAPIATAIGLYDVLKRLHPEGSAERAVFEELSGFMWGWAVNAARRCSDLGPVPNPAIMEIGIEEKP